MTDTNTTIGKGNKQQSFSRSQTLKKRVQVLEARYTELQTIFRRMACVEPLSFLFLFLCCFTIT